jgi:peptide deformylase
MSNGVREADVVAPEGPADDALPALEAEAKERRRAALAEVRTFGDPALRSPARPVERFGAELEREAEHMVGLMRDALGVGLAATQLGVMHRLLVFQAGADATPTAIANPRIEWLSDEVASAEEGCLSIPGIVVDVERALFAMVTGQDPAGAPLAVEASGLEARVLQHEIDHLDGVLILDRTSRDQKKGALRALREGTTFAPRMPEEEAEE